MIRGVFASAQVALGLAFGLGLAACGDSGARGAAAAVDTAARVEVMVAGSGGTHRFRVELARTEAEQAKGLAYRTMIPADGGMLFAPYPPAGPPRAVNFWMKDTPSPLDILFIRADGTIARIAENTVPFSEAPIPSGEPIAAVLEIAGGRAAVLGIAEGDTVRWTGA